MKSIIKYLVLMGLVVFLCFFKLPYYINAPGGLDNIDKKIKVEGESKSKGSINLTYVRELDGTIPFLIIAKINPNWEIHSKKESNIGTLDYDSLLKREQIMMKQSYTSAIKYAYEAANKEVTIDEEKCYVMYVFEEAKTDLEVGDLIRSVDGNKIDKCSVIADTINDKKENENIEIIVENNKKEYKKEAKMISIDDFKGIGIQVGTEFVLTTNPKYDMEFSKNEFGPSGGLMIALSVYNKLVDEDITGGNKIAGTGTLDAEGNVGPIGGVKFKLKGAVNKKAKVFFAPSGENYEEAIKLKEKHNYKIDVVEVKTFFDALNYLKEKYVK